jgi:mannose-1-phosphate guanylyltransferase
MNSIKRVAVIMAGGSGERFWPLSRMKKPKQLLKLTHAEKTMIEEAIDRIGGMIAPEDVYIFTSEILLKPLREALPQLPPQNVVAEPFKRNTAPCLAMAAAFLSEKYSLQGISTSEISVAVLTADHHISTEEQFLKTVDAALNFAENNPALVTIGIPPTRPETGYGYIEVEPNSDDDSPVKSVVRFREKPNYETALEFIEFGNYLWNSGMFFWRLDTFKNVVRRHLPKVGDHFEEMRAAFKNQTEIAHDGAVEAIKPIFEKFPDISIDYAIMEKAENVAVAKADFSWDDVGSWDSLDRTQERNAEGNVKSGTVALVDTQDSIVINSSHNSKMIVSTIGVQDLVVVVTDDAVLVCPKDRVQDVKKAVSHIRTEHNGEWL